MICLPLTDSMNSPERREPPTPNSYTDVLVKCQKQMRSKIDLGKKPKDDITSLVISICSLNWKW